MSPEEPYEVVVVKHIPSKGQYIPADRIIARHSWGPGDGRSYAEVYKDLNEFTADAIREWKNPTISSQPDQQPGPVSAPPTSASTKPNPAQSSSEPQPVETEKANWRQHSTGHGDWCRAQELPELREFLLRSKDHMAVIGDWRFKVWGSSEDMISRWQHRAKQS